MINVWLHWNHGEIPLKAEISQVRTTANSLKPPKRLSRDFTPRWFECLLYVLCAEGGSIYISRHFVSSVAGIWECFWNPHRALRSKDEPGQVQNSHWQASRQILSIFFSSVPKTLPFKTMNGWSYPQCRFNVSKKLKYPWKLKQINWKVVSKRQYLPIHSRELHRKNNPVEKPIEMSLLLRTQDSSILRVSFEILTQTFFVQTVSTVFFHFESRSFQFLTLTYSIRRITVSQ